MVEQDCKRLREENQCNESQEEERGDWGREELEWENRSLEALPKQRIEEEKQPRYLLVAHHSRHRWTLTLINLDITELLQQLGPKQDVVLHAHLY